MIRYILIEIAPGIHYITVLRQTFIFQTLRKDIRKCAAAANFTHFSVMNSSAVLLYS